MIKQLYFRQNKQKYNLGIYLSGYTMKALTINSLQSGGLITNYYCSSKCKHCLYACSPKRKKEYITLVTVQQNAGVIASLGCYSVHIGGGEPMLDTEKLYDTLKTLQNAGIGVEYVETNSSWYKDKKSAVSVLKYLKKAGLQTLLISISPFHNEFIPFEKVKGVMGACRKTGISVFPWIQDFYSDIDAFDNTQTHSLQAYQMQYGENYIKQIPQRYWIHFGGRAAYTYQDIFPKQLTESILNDSSGCHELTDTTHFHIDLYGNYIPGLCTGISIDSDDLGKPLDSDKYPLITALYNYGIKGLYQIATNEYGFRARDAYFNKCHLCLEIRKFLVKKKTIANAELQPVEMYDNL